MKFSLFQNEVHKLKSNKWRDLYLKLLKHYEIEKILEIGAGSPEFLVNVNAQEKIAFDGGTKFKNELEKNKITFLEIDLDYDEFPKIANLDVVICSDVFEHLIYPKKSLDFAEKALKNNGIFISHVPNEFYYSSIVKILLGLKTSNIFHNEISEYENPHIRRFTKLGFLDFLKRKFKYNIYISDIYYNFFAKSLAFFKLPVPLMFEPGPTFISTNEKKTHDIFLKIKEKLS